MNQNDKDLQSNNSNAIYANEKRKKKSGKRIKFNFIDLLLVLLLIASIVAVVLYFVPGAKRRMSATSETNITYILEFSGVDSAFTTNISVSDDVYDSGKNYMIGEVKTVENFSHTVLSYDDKTNTTIMKEIPGLKNIVVTVDAKAIYTKGEGYYVNGERIAVGREYNVRFPGFSGTARCIEVYSSSNS